MLNHKKVNGCWMWQGWTRPDGYGMLAFGSGRPSYAHRIAYTELVGPIPPGLTVDHLCRNKSCVNPAHLEVVTRAVNTSRASKGLDRRRGTNGQFLAA